MVYRWRYSQYGATSCFSCRTFYRRSVEAKAFKNYKCRSKTEVTGECDINVQSRFDPPPFIVSLSIRKFDLLLSSIVVIFNGTKTLSPSLGNKK